MHMRRRQEAGVGLQEILMTMAIVGIIAVVTIPNFNGYMKVMRARSTVNEMVGALNLGRQMAVTRRESYVFIPFAAPANTWQLRSLATAEIIRSGELPPGMTNEVVAAFQFDSSGACTNPTTYVGTTPQTQYVRMDALIQAGRLDQYFLEVSPAGRISTSLQRVNP